MFTKTNCLVLSKIQILVNSKNHTKKHSYTKLFKRSAEFCEH